MTAAISSESVDAAIGALEMSRRAGWAKAFRLESELAEVREQLRLSQQSAGEHRQMSDFAGAVLEVLAPSLSPWLGENFDEAAGMYVGARLFVGGAGRHYGDDFREVCSSSDREALRGARRRAARAWLAAPAAETDPLDAEALRTLRDYHGGLTGAASP
ncbi:hypothetical protein BHQ21_11560 [Mycobacterium sherrisii]|uniref:Uncharacterized protein n=1 Tax=Mycobacterium sherrisii TaxID=243061 RepID=A0A1E3SWG0_9MYCO|nr:hypothetical protein [Mycobacterium sherrisii]ODR06419.1 hypothetical protein BHQ21_11560 [Mycobacterium sherrisii]